jgi:alpha-ketoglutarate-dependent taurine dioxygenase
MQQKDKPSRLTTTLYDLFAALQDVTEPDEEPLVIALVTHWLRKGRITLSAATNRCPTSLYERS